MNLRYIHLRVLVTKNWDRGDFVPFEIFVVWDQYGVSFV